MQSITKTLKRSSCQPLTNTAEPGILAASSASVSLRHTPNFAVSELAAKCNELEKERDLAANMQQDFMGAANRNTCGVNLHSFCVPMGKTCGDALEIIKLDDDHLAILLVDATGHGLAASQLAMLAVQTIRSWLAANCHQLLRNPSEVLTKLNNLIYQSNSRDCLFVAATYAVYNERTQSVLLARGGNPYPMLYRRDLSPQQIESPGPLLGVLSDACFENIEIQLNHGDQLVLCSDGLTDGGLAEELSLLLQRVNDSYGVDITTSETDDRLTKVDQLANFEARLIRQAQAGELSDDVTAAVLQIPTTTENNTNAPQTKPSEQLALA